MISLLLTSLYSVDVAKMERDDRLLFECQAEVRELDPDEVISTWMKCDEKAVERELEHIRPIIQGFALEAQPLASMTLLETHPSELNARVSSSK